MPESFTARLERIAGEIDLGMDCAVHLGYDHLGDYVQIECYRKDVITGEMGYGYGGKGRPSPEQSDGQIIQMIFGLFLGYWQHEARENFQWKGRRIYGPHGDVMALWVAAAHVDIPSVRHVGERGDGDA